MALRSARDFSCPMCLDVFRDPVVLSCSHSFCRSCLRSWWDQKAVPECPVCKRRSSKVDPPCNLVLKNLCEAFSEELCLAENSPRPDDVCPHHGEKLKLFCLQHQQLVCLVCRDSRAHLDHTFRPVNEAARDKKQQLKESLKLLQIRLDTLSQVKVQSEQTASLVNEQFRQTQSLIHREFDKMRLFLQKEEQACIRDLRAEVELKSSAMDQKMAALSREMDALWESIRRTETELQSQDVPFLQNYSASVKRVQNPSTVDPDLPRGSLLDVAKHLGNLGFRVWRKMKDEVSFCPVLLDPNTACSTMTVSEDLRGVLYQTQTNEALPDNPERFRYYVTVLGSEGLVSGTHRWEVDVPDDADWALGVVAQSVSRKEEFTSGTWTVWRRNGEYVAFAPPSVDQRLSLRRVPRRIRVEMDCDGGTVSFYDPGTERRIYTFTNVFSEKLYPSFDTLSPKQMKILPEQIWVLTGQ